MVDATYTPLVYRKNGGNTIVVASGGIIEIETGGDITVNGVSLIDEVAALSGLDSGELGVLNAVTPGTVAASKAVVVDANKDIATFRHLTLSGNLVIGSTTLSEAEFGVLDSVTPGTGAASKVMTLDAGEDFTWPATGVLTYGGTAVTATGAELNYLDIAALGTGAASKAVVLSAGDDYRWPATGVLAAGVLTKVQGAPAAKTVTAGITAAELVAGLITTTGVTGPSVHQLPTGTEIDAVIPGVATGDSFDFTLINTGTGAAEDATITVNTDVTIVGNPTVGALTDATIISGSGTFRARRTGANTWVVYRLA